MTDKSNDIKCKHPGCRCAVADGAEYCSPHCEGTEEADVTSIACECGHAGCA